VALGAGARGEQEQPLVAGIVEQRLAVELDRADRRVDDGLAVGAHHGHVVPLPQRGELGAGGQQTVHEVCDARVAGALGLDRAQVRDVRLGQPLLVLGQEPGAGLRVGEVPPDVVALPSGLHSRAEQRLGHRVAGEHLPVVGHDLRGRVVQPVEDQQQPGAHVLAGREPGRRLLPGQPEEVVALVLGQPQRTGHRAEHLLGRTRGAALLQPGVVVHGDPGQLGDVVAAQPRRPTAAAGLQPDRLRSQPLAAAGEEVGELCAVHAPIIGARGEPIQGPSIPPSGADAS
jgi:hypothetical protein